VAKPPKVQGWQQGCLWVFINVFVSSEASVSECWDDGEQWVAGAPVAFAPFTEGYQKVQTRSSDNTTITTQYFGKIYEKIKQNTNTNGCRVSSCRREISTTTNTRNENFESG
jgi:hypothetical protein